MFRSPEEHDENRADVALRQGLRSVPVPETSFDFDARVHKALRRPDPWWRTLWLQARPVLSTALCSLLVTLTLLKGLTATATATSLLSKPPGTGAVVAYQGRVRMNVVDRDIEHSDLSAASWHGFAVLRHTIRLR